MQEIGVASVYRRNCISFLGNRLIFGSTGGGGGEVEGWGEVQEEIPLSLPKNYLLIFFLYSMDDSHRPVKLRKVVLGFPKGNNYSDFRFDLSLNYKLSGIIQTYSDRKPTLVVRTI